MSNALVERQGAHYVHPEAVSSGLKRVEIPLDLESPYHAELQKYVVGQDEAIAVVARELDRIRAGITTSDGPLSMILFAGQTGVGKTQLSEAIAQTLYGDAWKDHYKRVACNQLASETAVTTITGASPTWVGYADSPLFTPDFLNQEGGVVITFDEIEKAHPKVWHALLTMMDKGELEAWVPNTNQNGGNPSATYAALKFNNAILIFTSNAGAEALQAARRNTRLGFLVGPRNKPDVDLREIGLVGLQDAFREAPEFLGRIGNERIVVFEELGRDSFLEIFDICLKKVNDRLKSGMISVSPAYREYIIDQATGNGHYGARDITHAVQVHIVSFFARLRSGGHVGLDTAVHFDLIDGKVCYSEGQSVVPKIEAKGPESTVHLPSVEIELDQQFSINASSIDFSKGVEYVSQLMINGHCCGEIRCTRAVLGSADFPMHIHKDAQACTLSIRLFHVDKDKLPRVSMKIDGLVYQAIGECRRSRKRRISFNAASWDKVGQQVEKVPEYTGEELGGGPFQLVVTATELASATFLIQTDHD